MKTQTLLAAILLALTACASAANGEAAINTSNVHELDNFYGLVINSPANVILEHGDKSSIRFEGEQKDLNRVNTHMENGSLIISGNNHKPLNIYVTVGELSLIEVNGSARVYSRDIINSDMLLLKVNGSGSIRLDVRSLSLGMIVKGSGKIYASGSTGSSFARVYGNGQVYSTGLDAFIATEEKNDGNSASRTSIRKDQSTRPTLNLHN
jgi:formylmethanofuran dehydrogenase subunit C